MHQDKIPGWNLTAKVGATTVRLRPPASRQLVTDPSPVLGRKRNPTAKPEPAEHRRGSPGRTGHRASSRSHAGPVRRLPRSLVPRSLSPGKRAASGSVVLSLDSSQMTSPERSVMEEPDKERAR